MPNQFHILHGYASYQRDDVTGTETIPSACGVTLVRNRDDYCNISIANPDWNHNWCHDCVRMFPWTAEAEATWQKRGIKAMTETDFIRWVQTPEGSKAREGMAGYTLEKAAGE